MLWFGVHRRVRAVLRQSVLGRCAWKVCTGTQIDSVGEANICQHVFLSCLAYCSSYYTIVVVVERRACTWIDRREIALGATKMSLNVKTRRGHPAESVEFIFNGSEGCRKSVTCSREHEHYLERIRRLAQVCTPGVTQLGEHGRREA